MKDTYTRKWIIEHSVDILEDYDYGVLTIRGLYYRLVARGMTNGTVFYNRVVKAMKAARERGLIAYEQFSDYEREVIGTTPVERTSLSDEVEYGQSQIKLWMDSYLKNRWENQVYAPEIWLEKKALRGVFEELSSRKEVALVPCKGYPSLTFLHEAAQRFRRIASGGQIPVILYFGDYDASGQDIPRSISETLEGFIGDVVLVDVRGLNLDQVRELGLPHAPTKKTDSRAKSWDGIGQVELDAVPVETLQEWALSAIHDYWKEDDYQRLLEEEQEEREEYRKALKSYVANL